MMPLRRLCQHLHPGEGPSQESNDNKPLRQPSTQILPTITEEPEHPTFKSTPEVQLHQPAHSYTTTAGTNHQPEDAERNQVQIHDWDEEPEEDEAAEEEELARVQQEIERLRQEQESILRRQATIQRVEAHR
jgi:hypothetical protein